MDASITDGLSQEEAANRLREFGPNSLAEQKHVSFLVRLISKLKSPLILLLLFAGFISAVLGQISDFIIYVVITLVSSLLDAYQEHQAVGAAEKTPAAGFAYRDGTPGWGEKRVTAPGDCSGRRDIFISRGYRSG